MTIYIESFLIQNILINFCLIKLVCLTIKPKTSFFKMLLASIVGSVFSVCAAVFLDNALLLNVTKFVSAITIILIAFKQSKKQFVFSLILLFLYTFALGGAITSLSSSVYYTSFGAVMTSKLRLEIICLMIIAVTYIFELVAKHLRFKIKNNGLLYSLTLTHKNNSVKINAYLDTGNFLNYNGQPVIVLDLNVYLKLIKSNLINFYLNKAEEINTGTVSGKNNLKIFKIDKIKIKNEKNSIFLENQYIAVNTTNCFKNSNYQALLSPLFL